MSTRVLLLCAPGEAREAYDVLVATHHVACDTVETVGELQAALCRSPYAGLLLDVPTLIRANRAEKSLIRELVEVYPVVRLRWNPAERDVHVLFYGQAQCGGIDMAAFLAECAAFRPRRIRMDRRFSTVLNLRLCPGPVFDEAAAQKAVTFNVSEGGCFVLSTADWTGIDEASFVVEELKDRTPIVVDIRWRIGWGSVGRHPGIGVCYRAITPRQKSELRAINARSGPTRLVESY